MPPAKPRHQTLVQDENFPFQIPGHPLYGVTQAGRVRRLDTGNWLTSALSKHGGYYQVSLWENGVGKTHYVHQLVAFTFHGPRPTPKHDAAHGDGDKSNNHYKNIRWATRAENEADKVLHGTSNRGERNGSAKLTDEQARSIRERAETLPRSSGGKRIRKGEVTKLAAEFGVTSAAIFQIIAGTRHIHEQV